MAAFKGGGSILCMTARNAFGAKGGATLGRNGLEQTGAVVGEAIAQGGTEAAINTLSLIHI